MKLFAHDDIGENDYYTKAWLSWGRIAGKPFVTLALPWFNLGEHYNPAKSPLPYLCWRIRRLIWIKGRKIRSYWEEYE